MTNPTKTRRRFTPLQKQEAIELCLSEDLSCTAVAQRLGIPVSSLFPHVAQCVDELRKENRELRREKDFFKLAAAHFAKEQLPPRGFA
jgi:transposase-like protein